MKFTWDNVLISILLLFVIIFPFCYGTKDNYGQIWADISIVATIFYAFLIYSVGIVTGEFDELSNLGKIIVGFTSLLIIPVISLPFILGFVRIFSSWADNLYNDYFNLNLLLRMGILVVVSLLFTILDFIMMRKSVTNINYSTNFYLSDVPVTIIFSILLIYVIHIGVDEIEDDGLEHFYQGAIAFQLIFSNIIWMYNDNKFWKSIVNKIKN